MILILDGDEVLEYLRYLSTTCKREIVLRPQTSGPCVHIDRATDDDPDAVQALGLACRHPEGECPYLDTQEIICPVRDSCYATHEVAPAQETNETGQETRDQAMAQDEGVLHTQTHGNRPPPWTADEIEAIASADSQSEVVEIYRARVPNSTRTDGAIKSMWWRQQPKKQSVQRKNAWTDEELDVVAQVNTTYRDAIVAYRAAFPKSSRSGGGIRHMWQKLHNGVQDYGMVYTQEWAVGDRVTVGGQAGKISYIRGGNSMVVFDAGGPARLVPLADLKKEIK